IGGAIDALRAAQRSDPDYGTAAAAAPRVAAARADPGPTHHRKNPPPPAAPTDQGRAPRHARFARVPPPYGMTNRRQCPEGVLSWAQRAVFVPAAVAVAASPGANNLLAFRNGVQSGFRNASLALSGRFLAFAIMLTLVIAGLG